jgi:hypothetical protein
VRITTKLSGLVGAYGSEEEAFALQGLTRRLSAIGVPLETAHA